MYDPKGRCPGCAELALRLKALEELVKQEREIAEARFKRQHARNAEMDRDAADTYEELQGRLGRLERALPMSDQPTPAALDQVVKDLLDLNQWEETQGKGCVDALLCPYCEGKERIPPLVAVGKMLCRACNQLFVFEQVDGPMGPMWLTWELKHEQVMAATGRGVLSLPVITNNAEGG